MAEWTAEKRRSYPLKYFGDPKNRKYPVEDQSDLDAAWKLSGKADSPDAVKRRLRRIAKQLKLQLPKTAQVKTKATQDSGWNEFEGSLDDVIDDVKSAFDAANSTRHTAGYFASIAATYPDFILVHQYATCGCPICMGTVTDGGELVYESYYTPTNWDIDKCYKVPYTYSSNGDKVTFGDWQEVELTVVISAIESEDAMDDDCDDMPNSDMASTMQSDDASDGDGYSTNPVRPATSEPSDPNWIVQGSYVSYKGGMGQILSLHKDGIVPSTLGKRMKATADSPVARILEYTQNGESLQATGSIAVKRMSELSKYSAKIATQSTEDGKKDNKLPEVKFEILQQGSDELVPLVQESTVVLVQTDTESWVPGNVMHIEGIASRANVLNTRREVYPIWEWEKNLPRLQQAAEANELLGQADHPEDNKSRISKSCLKFTKIWQDDNDIKFKADILPTEPDGKNLQILIQNHVPVKISSRGWGRMAEGTWGDEKNVKIVQDLDCRTFDAVVAGASPGSGVSNWAMNQSIDNTGEESMDLKELAAQIAKLGEEVVKLQQAGGSEVVDGGTTNLQQSSGTPAASSGDGAVLALVQSLKDDLKATSGRLDTFDKRESYISLVQSIDTDTELPPLARETYRKHLGSMLSDENIKTADQFSSRAKETRAMVQSVFADVPKAAQDSVPGFGVNIWNKKSKSDLAPKTGYEAIERLIKDLPDEEHSKFQILSQSDDKDDREVYGRIPDRVKTPRRQMRTILTNMAREVNDSWHGPAAMAALLALEQGHGVDRAVDLLHAPLEILQQAIPNGATGVGTGGAPTSNVYLFGLVRRVFPQLFMQEVSSIQPMDRPEGKIFFLDSLRVETGSGLQETLADGTTLTDRARIDLGSVNPANPSFADDPGEFQTANLIQLRLTSVPVTAQSKKLTYLTSIEEVQDLRAYHGLDADNELMNIISTELAIEWNTIVLNSLITGAAAGNLTYGATTPGSWTYLDWQRQLGRFIMAGSNNIFKQRNGEMTHIVAGADAWEALASQLTIGAVPTGFNPEMYAGLIFTPFEQVLLPGVKTFKTNLWKGMNRNKILMIRRGTDWSDTPHVWAPYATYTAPPLTLPDAFSRKGGVMDRSAHKVVNGNAMSVLTIDNSTGIPLPFPTAS